MKNASIRFVGSPFAVTYLCLRIIQETLKERIKCIVSWLWRHI